jgi:hypothetical protein
MLPIAFFAVSCRAFMTLETFEYVLLESSYCKRSIARISCVACARISAPVGSSPEVEGLPPPVFARRVWNEGPPVSWAPVTWEPADAYWLLKSALTLMPHLQDGFVFRIIRERVSEGVEIICPQIFRFF